MKVLDTQQPAVVLCIQLMRPTSNEYRDSFTVSRRLIFRVNSINVGPLRMLWHSQGKALSNRGTCPCWPWPRAATVKGQCLTFYNLSMSETDM